MTAELKQIELVLRDLGENFHEVQRMVRQVTEIGKKTTSL